MSKILIDEATVKLALDDLIAEYHMGNSSFARRVYDIFKAALAVQPAQRTWVAVSDRIPLESDGEVLVRMRDGRCEIAWASNAFAQWTFRDPDEDEAPTHWMRIPAIEVTHNIKENT